jgi:hypothetical protein
MGLLVCMLWVDCSLTAGTKEVVNKSKDILRNILPCIDKEICNMTPGHCSSLYMFADAASSDHYDATTPTIGQSIQMSRRDAGMGAYPGRLDMTPNWE